MRNPSAQLPVSFQINPATQDAANVASRGQSPRDSGFRPLNLNFIILFCMGSGRERWLYVSDKGISLGCWVEGVVGHRCVGCVRCYYYF